MYEYIDNKIYCPFFSSTVANRDRLCPQKVSTAWSKLSKCVLFTVLGAIATYHLHNNGKVNSIAVFPQ